jgi:polyisoprenoid-binding protein YceI
MFQTRQPQAHHILVSFALTAMLLLTACAPTAAPAPAAPEPTAAPTSAPAAAPAALPTGAQTYIIDATATSASYIVDETFFGQALTKYGIPEGLVDTIGTTQAIEGQFIFNWDDLSAPLGAATFTVDLSTLQSDQPLRDGWIRDNGPQFGAYPNAIFVADSLANAPTSYTVGDEVTFDLVGQLTIREIAQPTTFAVTARLEGNAVIGVATADLRMTDFGIEPPNFANTLTVADDFQVRVEFTARAQ